MLSKVDDAAMRVDGATYIHLTYPGEAASYH